MSKLEITRYENNPEWDRIDVKTKWADWTIESYPQDYVSIVCNIGRGPEHLFLDQEELKQVIEFLQSKVK
jgi:hypothetical protein